MAQQSSPEANALSDHGGETRDARLALALAAGELGVWDWDLATNVMDYSPEARVICGFPLDAPIHFDQVSAITHPEDFPRTIAMARRAIDPALRENQPYEYRIVRPDGEVRWVLARGRAIFDTDGSKALRYIGTIQDITESKALALALEAREAQLRLAMEAARMAVWELDGEGPPSPSPELRRVLGIGPDEPFTLERIRQGYRPGEEERLRQATQHALDSGQSSFEVEILYDTAPDTTSSLLLRAEVKRDGAGVVTGLIGVLIDITERKRTEAALRESEAQLRALADDLPSGMIFQTVSEPGKDLRFTYVSSNCERLNGVSADAVLADATALYSLVLLEDWENLLTAQQKAAAAGEPFECEVRMRGLDGAYRWKRVSCAPRRSPQGAVLWDGIQIDIDARRRMEEALRESETHLRNLLDSAGEALCAIDSEGLATLCNRALLETLGFDGETEVIGRRLHEVIHHSHADGARCLGEDCPIHAVALHGAPTHNDEDRFHRRDGAAFPVEYWVRPLFQDSALTGAICTFVDITERREIELALRANEEALQALNATLEQRVAEETAGRLKAQEALRQAQKMEAIGQLTGGVAHDFNNLLTVIMGGLDRIRRSQPDEIDRIRRAADMAMQGAQRAESLTSRLLAFSRRQPLEPKPCDLNLLVRDMTDLLHRTLGESIELEGVLAPRLWPVEIDSNQLESAVLNLALNARDAMPEGGKLTLETTNTELDETYAETDAEVIPGQYVALSVSDTGMGIPKESLGRAFEPFFTTKPVGKGTGLGLSMVYGFVKQSGGHITLYSEEGHGTSVRIYLPRYRGASTSLPPAEPAATPKARRGEVVLIVEDNDEVRTYGVSLLTELGYGPIEAADAEAALRILRSGVQIDLLFTDVVLPGKSGRVLADEAQQLRPGLPVLFTTGYSRNAIVHHGRLDSGVRLLTKPFTFDQLAVKVRAALDEG